VLENRDYQKNLEAKVEERTAEVNALNEKLKESFLNYMNVSLSLIENYDPYLAGHSKRVALIAVDIGERMKLTQGELFDLEIAGLLHEVGLVAIPEKIRNEPFANLTEDEIQLIKSYPVFSQTILSSSKELDMGGKIIRHHLEHVDGTGFPDGLTVEQIPISSLILGVANAYDELITRRRFTKEKLPTERIKQEFAIRHLTKNIGTLYDGGVIDNLKLFVGKYAMVKKSKVLENVEELKPGMTIAADIHTKDGQLVIGEGNVLSQVQVIKLKTLYKMRLMQKEIFVYE